MRLHHHRADSARPMVAAALGLSTALHGWCSALIATVAPAITRAFSAEYSGWLTAGFFLAAAVAAPVAGRAADVAGARRVAAAGLVLITVAATAGCAAPTMGWVIVARVVTGIGTGLQYPAALAALRQARLRDTAAALTSIVLGSEIAFTTAPSVATVLSHTWGWRAVLLSPVVLAVPALVLLPVVPAEVAPRLRWRALWRELDAPGLSATAAAVVVAMVTLLAAPIRLRWTLLPALAALVALAWLWERWWAERPFLPRGLLTQPAIAATLVRHAAFYLGFYLLFYLLPPWLEARGLSHTQLALALAALPVVTLGTRALVRHIEAGTAQRVLLAGGGVLVAAAAVVAVLGRGAALPLLLGVVAALGVPNALVIAANQATLVAASPAAAAGALAGVYRSVQFLAGGLAGAALALAGPLGGVSGLGVAATAAAAVLVGTTLTAPPARTLLPPRNAEQHRAPTSPARVAGHQESTQGRSHRMTPTTSRRGHGPAKSTPHPRRTRTDREHRSRLGLSRLLALSAALVGLLMATPALAGARPAAPTCSEHRLPVQLGAHTYIVAGTLCRPTGDVTGVQVLVHGATYDRTYWDWPVRTDRLSYVQDALADGYATFAYDRLGAGDSDRPPGITLTSADGAAVLHQILRWIQAEYSDVTVVGHSLGSMIALQETATHNDADRLVVTGMLHNLTNVLELGQLFASLASPRCSGEAGQPACGYLTTLPGTRGDVFYSEAGAEPVIAWDEAHKGVVAVGQIVTAIPQLLPLLGTAHDVQIPVLVVVGQQDQLFCGLLQPCTEASVLAAESAYYTNTSRLDAYVEPTSGHDLTLHPTAGRTADAIATWITNVMT